MSKEVRVPINLHFMRKSRASFADNQSLIYYSPYQIPRAIRFYLTIDTSLVLNFDYNVNFWEKINTLELNSGFFICIGNNSGRIYQIRSEIAISNAEVLAILKKKAHSFVTNLP